ncbi:MAG: hypothetical protein P8Y97_16810, partial [Candidatus Lokiarchaeota archaeon]
MANRHSKSFFGQSTGITLQSSSKKDDYVFLKCIKVKSNGTWEKPSKGEGKTIKISLEELIMILKVFKKELTSWSAYHSYKDTSTQISFNWQKNGQEKIWINIGEYSKMLDVAQIELFKLLVKHLIKEKIEYATISEFYQENEDLYSEGQEQEKGFEPEYNSMKNSPIRTPNIENKSDSKKRKKLLKVVEIIEPNHATPETSS